jgi:protein-disulfide isomerase
MTPRLRRLVAALLLPTLLALPAGAQTFTEAQRAEIVEILREALARDPSILRQALSGMEAAEQRERLAAQQAAITRHATQLFHDRADPIRGNPEGNLTIVEFFDARCGYCKQLHPTVAALLARDRGLRVVLKDLPILGPNSVLASRALLAAQRQGRHAPLHEALMTLRAEPTEAAIRREAERVGLDWARLRRDMDDPAIGRRIEANLNLAQALGIDGTPALVIGSNLVPGAVDLPTLERLVAEARAAR